MPHPTPPTIHTERDPSSGRVLAVTVTTTLAPYGAEAVSLDRAQLGCIVARLAQVASAVGRGYPVRAVGSCSLSVGADVVPDAAGDTVAIVRGRSHVHLGHDQLTDVATQLAALLEADRSGVMGVTHVSPESGSRPSR